MNDFMIVHVKWLENEYKVKVIKKMNDFMFAHVKWLENEYKVKVIKKR